MFLLFVSFACLYFTALPVVSDVSLKEIGSGMYEGEGKYYGGYEGSSMYSWYRETNEGHIVLISGATSTTYEVTDTDYNCRLLFGYHNVFPTELPIGFCCQYILSCQF